VGLGLRANFDLVYWRTPEVIVVALTSQSAMNILRVFCLALMPLAMCPLQLAAVGTFIPATYRTDMVYDTPRDILYIANSNSVLRYQLGTDSFLAPFTIGTNLMGMDLSPDGNKLLVADATNAASTVWVHVIDLTTGLDTPATFPAAFSESGTFAVAFGADGAALISSRFAGSGTVPLRRYDPATGIATILASPRQDSMVSSSGDGGTIVIEESNISSGPVDRYDVGFRAIMGGTSDNKFNFECAASRDGALFAVPTYSGTFIYNNAFTQITNIGVAGGAEPIGAAFHPLADVVFFPFGTTTFVRVYSTTNWQMLAQFDFQNSFPVLSTTPHAFGQGRTRVSADGSIVFVSVLGGVRYLRHGLTLPLLHRLIISGNPAAIGAPTPISYGTSWQAEGTNLTISVPPLVETNGTRFVASGWTGTGSVPAAGAGTSSSFTLLNNSTLTWNWQTNQYQLTATVSGSGTVSVTNAWYAPGATASLAATAGSNFFFVRWLGNVPACAATNPTLLLTMDQPRAVTALFAFSGSSAAALAGDWTTFGNGPAHTGYFPGGLGNATFSSRWTTNISGLTEGLQQVAVAGGRIFVTPIQYFANGYLAALYETNGQQAWNYSFASAYSINPPTYDAGNVFVQRCNGSSSGVWSFNAATGATNWVATHGAQFENYFAPTIANGHVWVEGGNNGGMYGFDETTGAQFFFAKLDQIDAWDPIYYNGRLYTWIGSKCREHEPQTGTVLWTTNLSWAGVSFDMNRTICAADGLAYFTGASELVAVDLANRAVAWQATNSFSGTPAAAKGIVYAIAGTNVLAYSRSGQYLGSYVADSSLTWQPIVTDDVLIVASASKTYIFDLCSYNLRQTLPVGGYLSLANGVLYVASGNGQLSAWSSAAPLRMIYRLLGQGSGKQLLMQWQSQAGKSYDVWFTANLSTPFSKVAANLPPTVPFNSYQIAVGVSGAGFYRIEEH